MTLAIFAIIAFLLPAIAEVALLLGVTLFLFCILQKTSLPFRMPQRSGLLDPNTPHPGTGKATKGAGIYFFGNQKEDTAELWFNNHANSRVDFWFNR